LGFTISLRRHGLGRCLTVILEVGLRIRLGVWLLPVRIITSLGSGTGGTILVCWCASGQGVWWPSSGLGLAGLRVSVRGFLRRILIYIHLVIPFTFRSATSGLHHIRYKGLQEHKLSLATVVFDELGHQLIHNFTAPQHFVALNRVH